MQQVTFLGGGNMARALIQGLLRQGMNPAHIRVGEPATEQRDALQRAFGVQVTASNAEALAGARLVLLAVKPQLLHAVLEPLRGALQDSGALLLSIAAGVRLADLARVCPDVPLVRAMPNRAALVGAGVTALYAPPELPPGLRALAVSAMVGAGRTLWVERESDLDIATAVSGSGPAYFFLLAEHLARAGRELGLSADTAELLARETLRGAGALLAGPETLAEQRIAVTSKGGTTAAALGVFAAQDFGALVAAAVGAAARRSEQLAAQFSTQNQPQPGTPAAHQE